MAARRRQHRGEGSVYYSRSQRQWIVLYPLGMRDGHRRRIKRRCASEDAANHELDVLRRTYGAGGDPATMTLDTYLQAWLASYGPSVRARTRISYEGHVRLHISPLLGGIVVAKLRPRDVERLVAERLQAGCSPSTVHRIISTLHNALEQAKDRRAILDNPADGVRLPKVERDPIVPMSRADRDAILAAVKGEWLEPIVRLLLGTGMRLGEACGLDQGDVDLVRRFARVRVSKTLVRSVPVSDDAIAGIRQAIARAPRVGRDEPLFFGPRRTRAGHFARLQTSSVSHALPEILEAKQQPRLHPHLLRHGAATLMLAAGVHERTIGAQLGHRSRASTRIYEHVVPELQRDAVSTLDMPIAKEDAG